MFSSGADNDTRMTVEGKMAGPKSRHSLASTVYGQEVRCIKHTEMSPEDIGSCGYLDMIKDHD